MLEPKSYNNLRHKRSDLIQLLGTKRTDVLDRLVEHHNINVIEDVICINPKFIDYSEETITDPDEIAYIVNSILINMMGLHLGYYKSTVMREGAEAAGIPYIDVPVPD